MADAETLTEQTALGLKDALDRLDGGVAFYGSGHRKTAVARVWILEGGSGQVYVNKRPLADYCKVETWHGEMMEPFGVTGTTGAFDVWATAKGGGVHSQMQAVRHGIARALVAFDAEHRTVLRRTGYLTRDPRVKERKKFGRKRARRGFQFSKR